MGDTASTSSRERASAIATSDDHAFAGRFEQVSADGELRHARRFLCLFVSERQREKERNPRGCLAACGCCLHTFQTKRFSVCRVNAILFWRRLGIWLVLRHPSCDAPFARIRSDTRHGNCFSSARAELSGKLRLDESGF